MWIFFQDGHCQNICIDCDLFSIIDFIMLLKPTYYI